MLSAARMSCLSEEHDYLIQGTIWQPATGTVYINGKACGAVFDITTEWDKEIREAEEFCDSPEFLLDCARAEANANTR